MDSIFQSVLGGLDPNIVWIFVGMMAVCLVLAIIKKSAKIAVVVSLLIVGAVLLIPAAQEFQQNYEVYVEDGGLYMKVEGTTYKIQYEDTKSVQLKNVGSEYEITAVTEEDGTLVQKIPKWMLDSVKQFCTRYNIPFKLID